jgi:hypothetical protein
VTFTNPGSIHAVPPTLHHHCSICTGADFRSRGPGAPKAFLQLPANTEPHHLLTLRKCEKPAGLSHLFRRDAWLKPNAVRALPPLPAHSGQDLRFAGTKLVAVAMATQMKAHKRAISATIARRGAVGRSLCDGVQQHEGLSGKTSRQLHLIGRTHCGIPSASGICQPWTIRPVPISAGRHHCRTSATFLI